MTTPEAATAAVSDDAGRPPVEGEEAAVLAGRIDGLHAAVEAARGRLAPDHLEAAADTVERSRDRLRLSAAHTIVALAGATGSGKSSLFNALTGLDLAAVGVRRPTTSWATACAWDPNGATDLLQWLGVPPRHQVSRLSMLDAAPEDTELRGLLLLDLPDHDSTEISHHLEVDRLVRYVDLLVWVLDPQKYADAALHERYLQPHATHADVMFAVLNQVDRLTDAERDAAVADVRRLLAADGLGGVSVVATSAVRGDGMDQLRQVLIGRLQDKRAARARVAADVTAAAARLADHGGTRPVPGADDGVRTAAGQQLVDAVARAAGLDTGPTRNADRAARRARRAAGWPPLAMFSAERSAATGGPVAVDESLVDAALDDYVERVGAGAALPWQQALQATTTRGRTGLVRRVTDVSRSAAAGTRPPGWTRLLGVLQVLLLLGAIGAAGWQLAGDPPRAAGWPGGWLAAVILGAGALALAVVGGMLAASRARSRVERDARTTRSRVAAAVDEEIVRPVGAELDAYATWREGLAAAGSPQSA